MDTAEKRTAARPTAWIIAVLIAFGLSGGLVMARERRIESQRADLEQASSRGHRVLVAPVAGAPRSRQIQLPASIHGYIETPIYAKTAGYLKTIRVDKGDRVRAGELLATLESP